MRTFDARQVHGGPSAGAAERQFEDCFGTCSLYIETLTVENFQCFGPARTTIALKADLTAFVGANGSGKTAAGRALQRMFGITREDRSLSPDDFHVPADQTEPPDSRTLRIEVVLAFPELEDDDAAGTHVVPEFFSRMCATHDGTLKCRIVLDGTWTNDGSVEGTITDDIRVVRTTAAHFTDDECSPFPPAERARIQVVYVPASRDGARQITAFLRGRLWRAARWTPEFKTYVQTAADGLATTLGSEPATGVVQRALGRRWDELHDATTHTTPRLRPIDSDIAQLLRNTELVFEPNHTGNARPAHMLSDGQRSLLHLALTAAAIDVENDLINGQHADAFDITLTRLPVLTMLVIEEPENSLTPFFLSRIVSQIQQLCQSRRAQALISSHSSGTMTRIHPDQVRYFRLDSEADTAVVRPLSLPADNAEAGKYVREAVRAYPELYFARFVVLGEGDSEEAVIPRLAQAHGIDLDPSFVAMVPLGGRHTNHFWRLLNDLRIPHATLIDLDYGRHGGGAGRLREAIQRLADNNVTVLDDLDGYDTVDDINDDLDLPEILRIAQYLRRFGVFFSDPLDLDYAMLQSFRAAYTTLDTTEQGPRRVDPIDAVLGDTGANNTYWNPDIPALLEERHERLRWYRYLFLSRSKPSTHLRALTHLTDEQLKNGPEVLTELTTFIQTKITS